MIDVSKEKLLSLKQAVALLPPGRNGRPPHISLLVRKILAKELEALRLSGRWVTSAEALQRWMNRQTAAALGEPAPIRTAAARRRAAEKAERELVAQGV